MKTISSTLFCVVKFGVVSLMLSFFSSCTTTFTVSSAGSIWGTTYNVLCSVAGHSADIEQEKLNVTVFSALNRVDSMFNAFEPMSEISQLNSRGRLNGASTEFVNLVESAAEVNRTTGGAFDPTVGPVVNLWGFGSETGEETPSDVAVERALAAVGMDGVVVSGNDVRLTKPGARLDMAAIAKGYAADAVAEAIEKEMNTTDYLVEIGGEIRVSGVRRENEKERDWKIQITAPERDDKNMNKALDAFDTKGRSFGMATSGNYRNFRTMPDGSVVGHTVSPKTGRPVQTDVLSATVFADESWRADAFATAFMVMGSAAVEDFFEHGVLNTGVKGAVICVSDGKGGYDVRRYGRF